MIDPGCATWVRHVGGIDGQTIHAVVAAGYDNSVYVVGKAPAALQGGPVFSPPQTAFLGRFSATGTLEWSKPFTGGNLFTIGGVVQSSSSGGAKISFAGTTSQSIDFGGGPLDPFPGNAGTDVVIAGFDTDGQHLWSKRLQSTKWSGIGDVGGTPGLMVVGGMADGVLDLGTGPLYPFGTVPDMFLAAFDTGYTIWAKRFAGGGPGPQGIAVGAKIAVVARTANGMDFGGGKLVSEAILATYDLAGNHLWSKKLSSIDGFLVSDVALDAQGNILVTGTALGAVDFGGGPLTINPGSGPSAAVAKLDASGNHLWSRVYGSGTSFSDRLAVMSDGHIIVAGSLNAPVDFGGGPLPTAKYGHFLLKLDAAGNHVWSRSFSHPTVTFAGSTFTLAPTSKNGFVAAMHLNAPLDFGTGTVANDDHWDAVLVGMPP